MGRQFWQYPTLPKSKLQNVSATAQSSFATHMGLSSATTLSDTHAPPLCEKAHPRCAAQSRGSLIVSHCLRSAHAPPPDPDPPPSSFHAHCGAALLAHDAASPRSSHAYVASTHARAPASYWQNALESQCSGAALDAAHAGAAHPQCRCVSSHAHPSLAPHASAVAKRPQSMPHAPPQKSHPAIAAQDSLLSASEISSVVITAAHSSWRASASAAVTTSRPGT